MILYIFIYIYIYVYICILQDDTTVSLIHTSITSHNYDLCVSVVRTLFLMFIFEREREKEHAHERGAEKEGERESPKTESCRVQRRAGFHES